MKGRILVNTGDGKGKTTAALGLALRAWGQGMRVLILQFIKGNNQCGEHKAIEKLSQLDYRIEIRTMGDGFVYYRKNETEESIRHKKQLAAEAWKEMVRETGSGNWDVIICDEINYAIHIGFITEEATETWLKGKPENVTVVLTGRYATDKIIELADTVTEMKKIKHGYDEGIRAIKGIEY